MKRPTLVLGLIAITWLAVAGAAWWREQSRVIRSFVGDARRFIDDLQIDLEEIVEIEREDALLLARSPLLRTAVETGELDGVRDLMTAYANARRRVFQVRWLDPQGRERVRIERTPAGITPILNGLQNKSHRHYFQRSRGLAPGQVYVSPVDFNVEHGVVETPLRPTLRFATPVFTRDHQLAGVVVLNQDASALIDRVARANERIPGSLMLVHTDGTYVSTLPPERRVLRKLDGNFPDIARWVRQERRPAVRRTAGLVGVVAGGKEDRPRGLLVATEREILASKASAFIPLGAGLAVSAVVIAILFLMTRRQRRLKIQLQRETGLRREIAARQEQLDETQERLIASARLAALTESAAALAHELRNPLGAIVNSASLLSRDSEMDDDNQRLMTIVLEECRRLERSVADFLDLARRPTPHPDRVDVGAAVTEVLALARNEPSVVDGKIAIIEDIADGPLWVEADPDELRQILWNLMLNAGKATRRARGHEIVVSVAADPDGAGVRLEIHDEGPGPPCPGESLSESVHQGSGLGLIVAAGIVARHGGSFALLPGNGTGTCARVVFPPHASDRKDAQPEQETTD